MTVRKRHQLALMIRLQICSARDLLTQAVESALQAFLAGYAAHRYLYWRSDGVFFNLRGEDERACLLVIVGVLPDGTKEFVAIDDGVRESEQSWHELLVRLRNRQGLGAAPQLAIGDGALGFWKALTNVYPETRHQRCWVQKTANVLTKLPKKTQPKANQPSRRLGWPRSRRMRKALLMRLSRCMAASIRQQRTAWPKTETSW